MPRLNLIRFAGRASATCAVVLSLVAVAPVNATTFCVNNASTLQADLDTARTNNQDDVIEIQTGSYSVPSGGIQFVAGSNDDDHALEISGGWNASCSSQLQDPLQTVLDGFGVDQVMHLSVLDNTNVTIRLLTFADGYLPPSSDAHGAGLAIDAAGSAYAGTWTIERNAFLLNTANTAAGLDLTVGGGADTARFRVINNLFAYNHAAINEGAAGMVLNGGHGIYVTNNTVVNNMSDGTGISANYQVGGIFLTGTTGILRVIANNNLCDNQGQDLIVLGGTTGFGLLHNNVGSVYGDTPETTEGNISVTPVYQSAGLYQFIPARNSPLVDAGTPPPVFFPNWYLTSDDLAASDRLVGPAVDIGAYENERIFIDGFDPPEAP